MEGEVGAGYMLVPWSSWDQWNWVRESLFSSSYDSVAAALRRITAWKSRGCLPVAIDVTASIVEIQHSDPFFRKEVTNDTIDSDNMLAMLYSIALTRLVNGFVEKVSYFDDYAHKHGKKKYSISDVADAIGMPRKVVDIRHESSHRDLPSLPLVRLASVEHQLTKVVRSLLLLQSDITGYLLMYIAQALEWLKSHYWEPQRSTIPDIRKEVRSRLHQMIGYMRKKQQLRLNHSQLKEKCARQSMMRMCGKLSSQMSGKLFHSKNKGSLKQVSKIAMIIARLYSTYPYEVVSVLLEKLQSQASDPLDNGDTECNFKFVSHNEESHISCMSELKDVIRRLSRKKPGLLLTLLKEVTGTIEAKESASYGKGKFFCLFPEEQAEIHQIKLLSSLVPWLLLNLKELKNSGQISIFEETQDLPTSIKFTPKISLKALLRKCLLLSFSGNKHLMDSAIFVSEMIGNSLLIKRVKGLHLLMSQNIEINADDSASTCETLFLQEQQSIKLAIEKFDNLKSRMQSSTEQTSVKTEMKRKMWTVAERWTPCPIGTLPCTFSSTPSIPVLDESGEVCVNNDTVINEHECGDVSALGKRRPDHGISLLDNSTPKKLKEMAQNGVLDDVSSQAIPSMKGLLLVDGIWRKVEEEELLSIESNVRILV